MKSLRKISPAALSLLLLAGVLTGCGTTDALSVTTVKVKSADTLAVTDYSGTVYAATSMAVIPNISGKVSSVSVALGQEVRAGDTLMVLDTADAVLSLKQAQASYDSAQANYEKIATAGSKQTESQTRQALTAAQNEQRDAQTNYATVKSQYDSGASIAPAQAAYDSAKSEYDRIAFLVSVGEESEYSLQNALNTVNTASAQLETAKASSQTAMNSADSRLKNAQSALNTAQENYNLTVSSINPENTKAAKASAEGAKVAVEIAQKRLDDCTVKAPIDGIVSAVNVKAGDVASQQVEAFHVLGQSGGMKVEANVTESAAAKLSPGMNATVTLAGNGELREGTVSEISPMADTKNGMYLVRVMLADTDGLKDGMQATVRFAGNDDGSVLVPQKSILEQDGKSLVYVVRNGKTAATEVVPGNVQGAYIAVAGLTVGDEVVLQGAEKAAEGDSVRIVSNVNG